MPGPKGFLMTGYRESGVDLVQGRGQEGRFVFQGVSLRLGVFHGEAGWYVGVHTSSGKFCARLSLEIAKSQKEAKDMLRYGFFVQPDESRDLISHLRKIGLLSVPVLSPAADNVSA